MRETVDYDPGNHGRTDAESREGAFEKVSRAKKSGDKDALRAAIQNFFSDKYARPNVEEVYLAGLYAGRDLHDDALVDKAIEQAKRMRGWEHVRNLYMNVKHDRPKAIEAKKSEVELLLSAGEYRKAADTAEGSSFLTHAEQVAFVRRAYEGLMTEQSFLDAAMLARKYEKLGFSENEVRGPGIRAYQEAKKDEISPSEAQLIADELELSPRREFDIQDPTDDAQKKGD